MAANVSFATIVKEDIVQNHQQVINAYAPARLKALLAAFIRLNGTLSLSRGEERLLLKTDNAKIARFMYHIVKQIYQVIPSFSYLKNMKFNKKTFYVVIIESKVDFILTDLAISFFGGAIDRRIVYSDDTAAGYATGAFLAKGSVNSPLTSNYHLEIATKDEVLAKKLRVLIERFKRANFTPKLVKRRDNYVVYLKKSDQIGEFLIFVGATAASLQFEEKRIDRDLQNASQRLALCDAHNYQRTLKSADQQLADINLIKEKVGFDLFDNPKVKALCEIRLQHEDYTLQELADELTEVLGSPTPISKSNIAHLFRTINKAANSYRR